MHATRLRCPAAEFGGPRLLRRPDSPAIGLLHSSHTHAHVHTYTEDDTRTQAPTHTQTPKQHDMDAAVKAGGGEGYSGVSAILGAIGKKNDTCTPLCVRPHVRPNLIASIKMMDN
jgi:hypothetical protein